MLQVDDNENFAGFADAHSGRVLVDEEVVLEAGAHNALDTDAAWRGTVYDADKTEQTMRAFWRRWQGYLDSPVLQSAAHTTN
jgi:hypothetical protein